jgi:hypothetical protein
VVTFGRLLFRDLSSEEQMNRRLGIGLLALSLVSCRSYQYDARITDQDGLVPPDQFARSGKEQAQAIAIAREFGRAAHGDTPEDLAKQADAGMAYARTLPDVATIGADPQGQRLTITFKSGWRVAVPPIEDGKRGTDTPGLASGTPAAK